MSTPAAMGRSYAQLCGIATALDVIGDRWTPLVVRDLLLGPLRFGDLAEGLPGIGTNTLTARLKHLEVDGGHPAAAAARARSRHRVRAHRLRA